MSEGRIDDPNNYPGYKVKIYQADLVTGALLAGITYHLNLWKRWSVQQELQLGIARTTLDQSTLSGSRPDTAKPGYVEVINSKWADDPASGLTILYKIGPVYRLNNTIQFFLSADYWFVHSYTTNAGDSKYGSKPSGGNDNLSDGATSSSTYFHTHVMENPAMIDILLGIRVSF